MKFRRHCQQLGLCLFPPCYFIFLEPFLVRGISVFFVVFTLAFTTGWTSSGRLPFIGCFILFSQFILVCLSYVKIKSFVRSSSIDYRFRDLPGLEFGVGLVTGSCHSLFFLLACPFVFRVISFIYDVRVRGVVSMFNETAQSFFVWVVRERLLPCRVVVTAAKWVVSCTRITCIQPLFRCSLTSLAYSFFPKSVVVFSFPLLFHNAFFFIFGVLAISYPLVSLPD